MNDKLLDICNSNIRNCPSDDVYKKFNDFIFSNDTKILGKCLHRFEHFLNVKDLPGDIVEIGVFKGSGIATFSKFIDIYCPRSNKKVIGFDIFAENSDDILNKDSSLDKDMMNVVYSRTTTNELSLSSVSERLTLMSLDSKPILVKGDVADSIPKFLEENPGFRISMLYIDVDIERPTYYALKYLWPRLLPGAVILFDEYEYHKFSESCGVEKFLEEFGLPYDIKSTHWIAPTAYMYKKR